MEVEPSGIKRVESKLPRRLEPIGRVMLDQRLPWSLAARAGAVLVVNGGAVVE